VVVGLPNLRKRLDGLRVVTCGLQLSHSLALP